MPLDQSPRVGFRKRGDALGYRYRCNNCGQPFEEYSKRVPPSLSKALQVLDDPPPMVVTILRRLTDGDEDVDPDELDVTELEELQIDFELRGAVLIGPCCRDLLQ